MDNWFQWFYFIFIVYVTFWSLSIIWLLGHFTWVLAPFLFVFHFFVGARKKMSESSKPYTAFVIYFIS